MKLSKYLMDGLLFREDTMTKKLLIERGVFKDNEAKKDVYPALKGAIEFDLRCVNRDALQ